MTAKSEGRWPKRAGWEGRNGTRRPRSPRRNARPPVRTRTPTAAAPAADGRLIVLRRNAEDELLRHVAMMRVDFGARLDAWPTEQVREVLRSERYFQAVHLPGAFRIHPRNYALGLAAAAEQAGARIFEDTPALAMDSAGVRKRVDTPKGRVRAGHVVLAGGAQLGSAFRAVSETLLPV